MRNCASSRPTKHCVFTHHIRGDISIWGNPTHIGAAEKQKAIALIRNRQVSV